MGRQTTSLQYLACCIGCGGGPSVPHHRLHSSRYEGTHNDRGVRPNSRVSRFHGVRERLLPRRASFGVSRATSRRCPVPPRRFWPRPVVFLCVAVFVHVRKLHDCVVAEEPLMTPNKSLDRMTRSAGSLTFRVQRPRRAPRHRSANR